MANAYAVSNLFVGVDAHIDPLGSCEFAEDRRKNGVFCRADAGIGPYNWRGCAFSDAQEARRDIRRASFMGQLESGENASSRGV